MIRILHLLEQPADFQSERGALALSGDTGQGFSAELRRIGRGGDYTNQAAAVIDLRGEAGGFDILHAWGRGALTAAALSGRTPIVHSPAPSPVRGQADLRWLRAVIGYRDVQVICPTATMRRIHVERGVPLQRCHLIRPGVEFARIRRRRDPSLRAALGFADDDHVLLAAGESTHRSAHRDAVWAAAILHVLDRRYKVLLWGRGDQADAVARFAQHQNQPGLLSVAERRLGRRVEFEELLPAADIVLVTATGPVPTLPVSICMAAALPIIGTVTYTVSELLEDRHTALMVRKRRPRLLAQRILDLQEESGLQWSIADMARTEAYEYFALTRFMNQYRTIYRQVAAGEPVEVPEQAPGAGLRFHGRG